MDCSTLKTFRHDIYGCFGHAKDALFNTVDALLTEDRARSFPELSLSPYFERRWPSLYEGLEDGVIDQRRLCNVFAQFLPEQLREQSLWVGIDVSGIARPRARTSSDRSAQHVHTLPECKKPVTYGWQFSTAVALPLTPSCLDLRAGATTSHDRDDPSPGGVGANEATCARVASRDHLCPGSWL